jgi:hypothetical protein
MQAVETADTLGTVADLAEVEVRIHIVGVGNLTEAVVVEA